MPDGTDSADERAGEGSEDRGISSSEAFSLLGNPIRLEIVSLLHDGPVDSPARFSELYDHLDISDSAQFNYHLSELVPQFVTKTEDGYRLTSAGLRIAQAVAAGTFTDVPHLEPFEVEGECYNCGEPALWASYSDERIRIECDACDELVLGVRVPPSILHDREQGEVIEAFRQWARSQVQQARSGICPNCGGVVEPSLTADVGEPIQFEAVAVYACLTCGRRVIASPGTIAAYHPEVEAFHEQRGEAPLDQPSWTVGQFVGGEHVRILGRDPLRVRVSFFGDGDACHVEIDDTLTVTDVTVEDGGAPGEQVD